ncbi:hypothetical protein PIB30_021341 [Stylosanthes scabra]|uniref:Uncharacterized protein n=1 Tax=Stylosanthes scabra TaxID=79078 RepID=A0ABU6Q8P0_9FABA|nr:hypothetical protein [Stylosanthes scabra]
MEATNIVKADRRMESGRFKSTKPYWPKDSKRDIFCLQLTKDKVNQKEFELDDYIIEQLPTESKNVIWIIDSQDNCFRFSLQTQGEKTFITVDDLNRLKKIYGAIKLEFQLELRYIDWGLFYGIVWNEIFDEVTGRVDKNRYVRDILPTWILDLILRDFKLSYLDGSAVANSGVTFAPNKSPQSKQQTPPSLKRNLSSSSASTSKKLQTLKKPAPTRKLGVMSMVKTLTSSDCNTTRLYMPVKFTHTMAKAGINTPWYVIGPPIDGRVKSFKFELLPSQGRETELKIGGEWGEFCETYHLEE